MLPIQLMTATQSKYIYGYDMAAMACSTNDYGASMAVISLLI